MSDSIRRGLRGLALVFGLGLGSLQASAQDQFSWRWSGDIKNLLLQSKTAAGERYVLDRNRLRLALKGSIGELATVDLQYDNEVLFGDTAGLAEVRQQLDLTPLPYWSLQANTIDRPSLLGRHGLYRASINFSLGQTDIRVGRQRITWGTGRFWSPLDLLNPVTPIALDRSERLGVDAVLIEQRTGPLSSAAAVYAPDHDGRNATRALRWHNSAGRADYSVVAGRFRRDDVIGLDLEARVGQAVLRAEWTRVRAQSATTFDRALIGLDHAFANTLTLSVELHRDGSGATDRARYDFAALASGRRQTLARRYLGLHASYDVAPLVKLTGEMVVNLVDRSRYIAPVVTWSVRPDIDWSFDVQHFGGSAGSELQRFRNMAYVQLQWYF